MGTTAEKALASIDDVPPPEPLPEGIGRWNWGAFLLNWIWGVGNNTYIALLTLIPFFGLLVVPFVLGAKGDAWAWRNGRWDSVAHFRRVQRRWAIWGFLVAAGTVLLFGAVVGGVLYGLNTSDAYRLGVARVQESRTAAERLGSPISTGMPSGSISISGASGEARLDFSVAGPKASGRVVLEATRTFGVWALTDLELRMDGNAERLDLLHRDGAGTAPGREPAAAPG